jgi:hypothetical protein
MLSIGKERTLLQLDPKMASFFQIDEFETQHDAMDASCVIRGSGMR